MKRQNLGFKGMIRDRCPRTVSLALKFFRCKNDWINHVYDHNVKFLRNKDQRNFQCRVLLGLARSCGRFTFEKTIDWDNITTEEAEYWYNINSWVVWFEKNWLVREQLYKFHGSGKVYEHVSSLTNDKKLAFKLTKYVEHNCAF